MGNESHISCCRVGCFSSVIDEVICHFPYALLSLTIGLIALSFATMDAPSSQLAMHFRFFPLFHTCHFMHISFAAAGCFLTFLKYSRSLWRGFIIGALVPVVFCVLSDIFLPYIGGIMLGVPMQLHICFVTEYINVSIFLIVGILAGAVLRFHVERKHAGSFLTRWLHFGHILLSSLASLFYLVSYGFTTWTEYIGPVYILLVIAVVVPCTFSDLIVPVILARSGGCDGCDTI